MKQNGFFRAWSSIKEIFTDSHFLIANLVTFIGTLIVSVGVNGIVVHQYLISGGLTGISLGLYYLMEKQIPLGYLYVILTIPIFLICRKIFTFKHLLTAALGSIYFSINLILTKDLKLEIHDPLNAILLAAVIIGLGIGLFVRYGGSAGGIDLLAVYLRRKFSVPVGSVFNAVNVTILAFALFFHDLDRVIYSAILFFVSSLVVDKVQTGFSQRQGVYIITSKPREVGEAIANELHRGYTFLKGVTGYQKKDMELVFVIINMIELGKLKSIVYQIDEQAFFTVFETKEVIGRKFLNWKDKRFS